MTVHKEMQGDILVLSPEGRLDTTTAAQFQKELLEAVKSGNRLLLDFEKLVYVSSAGLRTLLIGQKALAPKKQTLTLCHVSPQIMEVFEMTGFSNILAFQKG